MSDQLQCISRHVYRFLLYLYPVEYRMVYGNPMMQTFDDLCHEATRRSGSWGLIRLWLATSIDLIVSASREQVEAQRRKINMTRYGLMILLLVIVFSVLTGYINLNASEVQAPMACILLFSFLAGLLQPKAAWRWGLLIGLSIPLSYMIGFGINYKVVDPPHYPITLVVLVIPALIATYGGVVVRWVFMPAQRQVG